MPGPQISPTGSDFSFNVSPISNPASPIAGRSSPVYPINNFSRPSSAAPPLPRPLPSALSRQTESKRSTINNNGTEKPSANIIKRKSSWETTTSELPSPQSNKPFPIPGGHLGQTNNEPFVLGDVPTGTVQQARGEFAKSMAVSTRDMQSMFSARISHFDSNSEFMLADYSSASPVATPQVPRPQATHSIRPHRTPVELPSRNSNVHPSSQIILSSPSPHVHRLMNTRRYLLQALETATLPVIDSEQPIPWWQDWATALPLLWIRTLTNLRTTNTRIDETTSLATGGQGMYLANVASFRWCLATRTHGAPGDFAHPSFYSTVAAGRAIWIAMYRDVDQHRLIPQQCIANAGRRRRRNRFEGAWLARGGIRGVSEKDRPVDVIGEDAEEVRQKEATKAEWRESGWLKEERRERWGWKKQTAEPGSGGRGRRRDWSRDVRKKAAGFGQLLRRATDRE
jgi:hypothetical protein